MRARDLITAILIPFILFGWLYFYMRGPQVYRPENIINRLHSGQNLTIVFFGDSITYGYGEPDNYVYMLRMRLKQTTAFDHTRIINAGAPGNTAADGLARIDSDVMANKPDLLYIAFGGNDLKNRVSLTDFENNLRSIVQKIKDGPHSEIILMTMPIFDIPLTKKAQKQFNAVIRKVAKDTNVGCLDIYDAYDQKIGFFGDAGIYMQDDHIHPNKKGHQIIFDEIWRTIE